MAEGKEVYKSEEKQVRYAIVRVDGHCPNRFEAVLNENVCKTDKNGECYSRCSESRYGDTKEQLIKKLMTAFKIAIKKNKEGKFIKEKSNNRQVAEIIAEYLGVK